MLKLIALGTLGYVAYRYVQRANQVDSGESMPRVAGGPLSSYATVQSDPDSPPPGPA